MNTNFLVGRILLICSMLMVCGWVIFPTDASLSSSFSNHYKTRWIVYQRTISGFNIFYDLEDYIVYYTIFSVLAVKYNIIVYGLCLMIDHIHSLFTSRTASTMSRFISHVTSLYVKEYNSAHDRKGPLFDERFGSSIKIGLKMLRTAISYLYNNPVEKQLCDRAQEFRWNFLAYVHSKNPFSKKIIMREASSQRLLVADICHTHSSGECSQGLIRQVAIR